MSYRKALSLFQNADFSAIQWGAVVFRDFCLTPNMIEATHHKSDIDPYRRREKTLKVTVLGAGGAVGEPLSMMLKQSPLIDELALFDICNIAGMGLDISHMDTRCKVSTFIGEEELRPALADSRVVVMLSGVPYKIGETMEQHFCKNARIASELSKACRQACPDALIAVVTSPINSIVPVVCETFQPQDNRVRVFGVMGADVLNANSFVAEAAKLNPEDIHVPVIGGSSCETVVPVLSGTRPTVSLAQEEIRRLVKKIQVNSGDAVMKKECPYNNHLSMAFATARFTISLCKGIVGQSSVVDCAYVRSKALDGCPYLATQVELGPCGVSRNWGLPKLTGYEQLVFNRAVDTLRSDIHNAIIYMHGEDKDMSHYEPPCQVARHEQQSPSCL